MMTAHVPEVLPRERLTDVLARWPGRWSAHTIAAAYALSDGDEAGSVSSSTWAGLLDVIEARLADVAKSASESTE